MNITLSGGTPAAEQIRDQLRGLISSGQLAADQRIPSVRQLAHDLGVAPGTVAKEYRTLEKDGILVTRIGAGTRVATTATTMPRPVLDAAHHLNTESANANLSLDDTIRLLRAIWRD